ncbi:uncharacterized protein LOC34617936 [Cyclospora cayetanensis]|uniref:Uncharacterized protein LOC34617936 n=1 Tax=Cyclospora cayetanensis TaxID=88456 RepID=A0A6P6RWK1_9EIME|nr:uncharacterized protein LOC34617936 [Cyclospora cayetanensis]
MKHRHEDPPSQENERGQETQCKHQQRQEQGHQQNLEKRIETSGIIPVVQSHSADTPASKSDTWKLAVSSLPPETLLVWTAAPRIRSQATAAAVQRRKDLSKPPDELSEQEIAHEEEAFRNIGGASYCLLRIRGGTALDCCSNALRLPYRHGLVSDGASMRQLLLAEEERTAFFCPRRLPLVLQRLSRSAMPLNTSWQKHQQQQGHVSIVSPSGAIPNPSTCPASTAATDTAHIAAALRQAEDASNSSLCFVLPLLWAVASWHSWLADPLPATAAAAAAALGLDCTTGSRAAALAAAEGLCASPAASASRTPSAVQHNVHPAESSASLAAPATATACLPRGVCPRLAALRALAYWCCCCTLAQQKATNELQRRRQRQQSLFQPVHAGASGAGTVFLGASSSSSTALLRQLQQECRDSFAQLLQQQQEAQKQLAERQGIEMESACALKEKQEQLLHAAAAVSCSFDRGMSFQATELSRGTATTAATTATAAATVALEACEKDLEALVLQHVSECDLLEKHWKHEQKQLVQQQLRMFKDVATDLYLLQHGADAAASGAACQKLVLPPLPSAGETDKWAFSWSQQQQEREEEQDNKMPVLSSSEPTGDPAQHFPRDGRDSPRVKGTVFAAYAPDAVAAEGETASPRPPAAAARTQAVELVDPLPPAAAAASGSNKLQPTSQQQQQQRQQIGELAGTPELTQNAGQQQQLRHHPRQVGSTQAAARQGPPFDMPRLLQGMSAPGLSHQHAAFAQKQQQLQQFGAVKEHAQVRLIFGAQQRRAVWLHICTGLVADFFPPTASGSEHLQVEEGRGVLSAGEWLSLTGRGESGGCCEGPSEDWPGGSSSYCYVDVRSMRGSSNPFSFGGCGCLGRSEPVQGKGRGVDVPCDDLFAALQSGSQSTLSGAVLPTGVYLQESCACIRSGNEAPDLLLPSLEEQRRLLQVAVHSVRHQNTDTATSSLSNNQRVVLKPGEVFVSRHSAGSRPQVCFHLAVAFPGQRHDGSQPCNADTAAGDANTTVLGTHSGSNNRGKGAELECLSAPVCEGLRQVLWLCEQHAVGAVLVPLLLLETEGLASCLPFALLQRRMLAVLRCLLTELKAVALSPGSSSCCSSEATANRLKHLVLLLPPIQPHQQQQEGTVQMDLLVQAAVNFLRNSACCC